MRKKMLWRFLMIPLIFSLLSVNTTGVTAAQETHDIAVVSVTITTPPEVDKLVNITVVVKNNGTETETGINVTVYYDNTAIGTQQNVSTLGAGANTSLTFTWDTTDVDPGTYTILAMASPMPGETNIKDNTLTSTISVGVSISPYIAVIPHSTADTTLTPGENYTISIYTDYSGTDVWGWEFTLTYNPSVLQGVEVTNGDLITKAKNETATFMPGTFNNTLGKLSKTGASFLYSGTPLPLTSGPGTLANVTFTVVGTGDSDIELGTETIAPSRLIGYTEDGYGVEYNIIDDWKPDLGHILHGYFGEPATHDVAVVSVTPSPTSVEKGELVNITVVVKNNGTVTETFDVKVYYDQPVPDWLIDTKTVSNLENGTSTSLTFTWNTTDAKVGDHTVIAKAIPVLGEDYTENNILESDETVKVTLLEQPLPIELIIGVVAVAVVAIAIATYAVKRRKKPTPE